MDRRVDGMAERRSVILSGLRLAAVATAVVLATTLPALAAVRAGAAKLVEFPIPTPASGPSGIAAGPDGNLWFAEQGVNAVGRITPGGAVTEFPLPRGCCVDGIAAGPDGNLWVTVGGGTAGRIGRLAPDGTYTDFALPSGHDGVSIAVGPDGNLWFTETPGNRIGRITTAGEIVEFKIPTAGGHPWDIAAGADGNLWFTEVDGNKIGRITIGGEITEFTIPTPLGDPWGIAAGPDGNVWFTESAAGKVGRITPAGAITEFAVRNGTPQGIAAGPDGNLWLANGTAIGRITPAGVYTEPVSSLTGGPRHVAVGPDGNLWLTENAGNAIGRVNVAASGTRYVLSLASGFVPATRALGPGDTARWVFAAPAGSFVTDASGMNLFSSGPLMPVSYYSFRFTAAGSYAYRDTLNPISTGRIKVAALASPPSGTTSTTFTVTWAAAAPPTGWVSDVSIKRPGATKFSGWKSGQTTTSAPFVPDARKGVYVFRARLRKLEDGTQSDWSPTASITVS
jgi:virginiamycin B lyase